MYDKNPDRVLEKAPMKLRLVVLVSTDSSDIYFANQLVKRFNVVGVVAEKQQESVQTSSRIVKALKFMIQPRILTKRIFEEIGKWRVKKYGDKNNEINKKYFGEEGTRLFPADTCKIIYTEGRRTINKPVYTEEIKKLKPDIIAVCGTSVLKKEILAIPPRGVINLHGGLAQEYRGVWTTHWALINEQPEYIGATVHYVSEGIDDGHIIYQGRPRIEMDDNPATLYVKVVKLGIAMMTQAIQDIENDSVRRSPLLKKGNLYLEKMMTHEQIGNAWKRTENGTIRQYLREREERDAKVELAIVNKFVQRSMENEN